MNKQDYFTEFVNSARDLYFIVTKDSTDVLKQRNFFFYMNKEKGLSLVGFTTRDEADNFLRSVFPGDNNWKIISLDRETLDTFLDTLDPDFREKLVFELI